MTALPRAGRTAAPDRDRTRPRARATILVVDDDTANLASLVKIFEKLGLRVLPGHERAARRSICCGSRPVDVVLTRPDDARA
jgi:CheY-like chemotaxis protein